MDWFVRIVLDGSIGRFSGVLDFEAGGKPEVQGLSKEGGSQPANYRLPMVASVRLQLWAVNGWKNVAVSSEGSYRACNLTHGLHIPFLPRVCLYSSRKGFCIGFRMWYRLTTFLLLSDNMYCCPLCTVYTVHAYTCRTRMVFCGLIACLYWSPCYVDRLADIAE